jgi:hypothetical protein
MGGKNHNKLQIYNADSCHKYHKVQKKLRDIFIQINHQLDATVSPVYYPDVYLQFNMFRASSSPSSGAQ